MLVEQAEASWKIWNNESSLNALRNYFFQAVVRISGIKSLSVVEGSAGGAGAVASSFFRLVEEFYHHKN